MQKIHLLIIGDVTEVGFRAWTIKQAKNLELTGWVRNVSKSTVEVVAEGEKEKLEEFIKLCQQGPEVAWVEKVKIVRGESKGEFVGFRIKY